ncbi:MAG TPA: tetratricopeptide repeat protein, partial [Armatimonadetes bacterium]|nr:tetratricopeptide repeat protein [Armatimonadota bacterium]
QQKYAEALGWLLAVERWVERPTAMRETVRAFRDIFMRHFCADLLQALVETALERNMHRETLYMLLTDLHTMGRNYNAAVVWARRGLARFPKNIWLKKVQLENLKRSARWRDAEHFLDRECRRNPHQPYFAAEKIWLYYRWRSKFELPRQRTEFALTLRRERNARNAFMKQFRQTPLASVVYGIALYDDFRSLQSLPQDACTVLETALKERLPDGDVHETIGTVRRALAMCYARMGKWSKARRQYQALLYSARNDVERMVILQGWLTGEIAKKRWRSAIAIAHAVLRGYEPISLKRTVMAIIAGAVMMPQNISAWQRSKVEEDVNARYNTFNQWFEQRKTDPLALLMAAEVARARGDERQASSYYETALVRAPDLGNHPARWDLIELIADALITLGKRERSQTLYEQLIKTQPTRRSIYPKLLRSLMERGDNQKALKIARQMMIYAPWHASTLFQYAHVLAANRQVEAALKWLDRAIEVARSDTTVSLTQLGTYCLTKARLLEQMGKLEDAIPVYREVAQGAGIRRIVRRVAIQRLYQYYEVRGDTKEQIYWLRWLIWATPDENERRQLKQRLQELERALKQAKK